MSILANIFLTTTMMPQNILKHLPLTTLILTYLFVCGCLFLIGFWSTFKIDVSPFINLLDITKSFVYPLILTQSVGLILFLLLSFLHKPNEGESTYEWMKRTNQSAYINFHKFMNVALIIALLAAVIFHSTQKHNHLYWEFFCLFFIIFFSIKLWEIKWLNDLTKSTALTFFITFTFLALPIFSFQTGKLSALDIYNNKVLKIVKIKKNNSLINDNIEYKLVGFLSEKAILSTLDNKVCLILNQSSYDLLYLEEK